MKIYRNKTIVALIFLSIGIFAALPASAAWYDTGIIPQCTGGYCTLCDAWQLADNIINFLLQGVAIPILTITLIWGGFLWVTSGTSPDNIKKGKTIMTNGLIGILIAFCGWLIVDTIIKSLASGGEIVGAWSTMPECKAPIADEGLTFQDVVPGAVSSRTGVCSVAPASNTYVSVNALSSTCMSPNERQASQIAMAESRGDPTIPSRVDICKGGGTNDSVSWGLFQINISANTLPGLNCPSAFQGRYTGISSAATCKVIDRALYDRCVAAAKNPTVNIQKACELSKGGNDWGKWGAATKCGLK